MKKLTDTNEGKGRDVISFVTLYGIPVDPSKLDGQPVKDFQKEVRGRGLIHAYCHSLLYVCTALQYLPVDRHPHSPLWPEPMQDDSLRNFLEPRGLWDSRKCGVWSFAKKEGEPCA